MEEHESANKLVAGVAGIESERASGFREFSVGFLDDEGQVRIARNGEFERFLQLDLPGGARQEIGTPDDIINSLVSIVDDDRELVCKDAVAPPEHRVAQCS